MPLAASHDPSADDLRSLSGGAARPVSDSAVRLLRAQVMTRTEADRIADLRNMTDDDRYAMLAWLARHHPEVFDSALAASGAF